MACPHGQHILNPLNEGEDGERLEKDGMPCVPGKLGRIGIGGYKKNGRAFMMKDGIAREREAVGLSVGER